ncbi:MAG: Phosphoserine phosphatase RsbU [Calditrichaeota bacterium]|nr:Phosphoserine phosphatase RsbU [Calditrichota bacterium]
MLARLRESRSALSTSGRIDDPGVLLHLLATVERLLTGVSVDRFSGMEFELLRRMAMLLARAVEEEEILAAMLDGLREVLPFDAAGVYLVSPEQSVAGDDEAAPSGEDGGDLTLSELVVRGYYREEARKFRQKFDEGIVGWTIANSRSIVVDDVRGDHRYIELRSETRSELAVPIISRDVVIGAINLESDRLAAFPVESVKLVENLASYAAVALERAKTHRELTEARAVERELEIAREIQSKLLPKSQPAIPGYDLAGLNAPSAAVGGDYYDFIPITSKDLGLVIADVAGKGFAAGMVMASLRSALRMRVETTYSIRHVIATVNRFLFDSTGPERYVTAFYGVLDTETFQLTYVNAGHNPPLLLNPDGGVSRLTDGGPVLGVIREAEYEQAVVTFAPGSMLVMFTDGIIEAGGERGEELGEERIIATARRLAEKPARTIAAAIEREAVRHHGRGRPIDDRTVIVVKNR